MPCSCNIGRVESDDEIPWGRCFLACAARMQSAATPRACSTVHLDNISRTLAAESFLAVGSLDTAVSSAPFAVLASSSVKKCCSIDCDPHPTTAAVQRKNCPDGSTRQSTLSFAFLKEDEEKKIPCTANNPYELEPGKCCVALYIISSELVKAKKEKKRTRCNVSRESR